MHSPQGRISVRVQKLCATSLTPSPDGVWGGVLLPGAAGREGGMPVRSAAAATLRPSGVATTVGEVRAADQRCEACPCCSRPLQRDITGAAAASCPPPPWAWPPGSQGGGPWGRAGGTRPAPACQPVSTPARPRRVAIRAPCVPCALAPARGLPWAAWGRQAVASGGPHLAPRRAAGEPIWAPKSPKKPKTFHY